MAGGQINSINIRSKKENPKKENPSPPRSLRSCVLPSDDFD
jgi:hypothetical protein